mgnify:CR=1 FL=1
MPCNITLKPTDTSETSTTPETPETPKTSQTPKTPESYDIYNNNVGLPIYIKPIPMSL